ncbi:hypothetical protein NEFER03_0927 [Nematocida sp. LUAm3]|nr:hypothetical protein NEFER03_0927 [Nematocida sp. LUAm3]KAI5174945.1 hypothetical protein NEFER02_1045 [Nematocida sp. LUAm2]KAI5177456.1 hypothetical protein NEFER01_0706 [Nematocida sp. LUAm1]
MKITRNYCFTGISNSLKVEKKTKSMLRPACGLFLMLIALLSLDCALCFTKDDIARTFLEHYILKNGYMPTTSDICKCISYRDPMYSVDLKDYSFTISADAKKLKLENWQKLKNVLKNIGAIRCASMLLQSTNPEKPLPFSIVKMFIERLVGVHILNIYGVLTDVDIGDIPTDLLEPCRILQNRLLSTEWAESNELQLHVIKCSSVIFNMVMGHYRAYMVVSIFFEDLDIKQADLSTISINKKFSIWIKNLPEIESIVFPNAANMGCEFVYLNNIPQLKEIVGGYKFLSTNTKLLNVLNIDENVFKLCGKSFTKEMADLQGKILEVEFLQLVNMMPFSSKEIEQQLFFSPWIHVGSIYIHVLSRACYMLDVKDMYTLKVLFHMGISILEGSIYYTSMHLLKDINIHTQEFLKGIAANSSHFKNMEIMCPGIKNVQDDNRIIFTAPSLYILLKRSNEIRAALDKFQEQYDALCTHIGYSQIEIDGSSAPENWTETLWNMLSCMGYGITANGLSFCNMEEPVEETIHKDLQKHFRVCKYKFVLKELCFDSCKIGFIRSMLTKYSYAPKTRIYIDCEELEEEDVWSLFRELVNYHFSSITIKNAFKLIQRIEQKGYLIEHDKEDELVLTMELSQWFSRNIHITEYIFLDNFTLSSPYLSALASKNQDVSNERQNGEELYHFLVGEVIAEACAELRNFSTQICYITHLDILICNSNVTSFTTAEELLMFIEIIKRIFVDVQILSILNLRIKEDEIYNLHMLNVFVDKNDQHKLKNIFLRRYTILNAEDTTIAGGSETKTLHYSIGGSYLNYQLKRKLIKKNVSINRKALPFVFGNENESGSGANLEEWEKNLIDDEQCPVCIDWPEFSEIYIMRRCKHWICRQPCAVGWHATGNTCPICRNPADFNNAFYVVQPKDATKENLTEDDFEFVVANAL